MRTGFFSDKRREFIARSGMDLFKLLLPTALMTGLFVKPIPGGFKVAAAIGLVVLFWLSIWVLPEGD